MSPNSPSSGQTDTKEYIPENELAASFYGPPPVSVRVAFGALSHVGLVRKNNEDHYGIVQRLRSRRVLLTNVPEEEMPPTQEEAYALVVADGMGGEACGELASRLALKAAWELGGRESRWLMNASANDRAAEADIEEQLQVFGGLLNDALRERAELQPEAAGMGTTLTVAYTVGRQGFVAHIGDSRAYLIRGSEIFRLTSDHTLAEEMLASGATEAQVKRYHHVLSNCLSSDGRSVMVEFRPLRLESGDWLLLCTDGLTDLVLDREILSVVILTRAPQPACDALISLALERGGRDNVTVVIGHYEFL
jgi:PPM family protein phosphatase